MPYKKPASKNLAYLWLCLTSLGILIIITVYNTNNPTQPSLRFARIFGDSMVLQSGPTPVPIWGFSQSTNPIVAWRFINAINYNILDTGTTTITKSNSLFRFWLPPILNASKFTSYNIQIWDPTTPQYVVSIHNILFGDVVLCSGQSNMQMSIAAMINATEEIKDASNYPFLRFFTMSQTDSPTFRSITTPQLDLLPPKQTWSIASASSVTDNTNFGYVSAICYYYGRHMYRELNIPIGLISNAYSGSCINLWLPTNTPNPISNTTNANILYNAFVAPLTVGPFPLSAILWSQGECDVQFNNTVDYSTAFPNLISGYRKAFGSSPLLPFLYELLPPYIFNTPGEHYWLPQIRLAQIQTAAATTNAVVINSLDLGDFTSPMGSIHPRFKQPIGERMAKASLYLNHNIGSPLAYTSPTYITAFQNSTTTHLYIQFSLHIEVHPSACPTTIQPTVCAYYDYQTTTGAWFNATSISLIDTHTVQLGLANITHKVIATRGSYGVWPVAILFGKISGLPALPYPPTTIILQPQ